MSNKNRSGQYADAKGVIVETHEANVSGLAEGATLPADGVSGFGTGSLFMVRAGVAGAQLYVNEGTKTSCAFKPIPSQVNAVAIPVAGVAAGYKLARGQATVTGTLTVVTGLATVVSVTATLDDDPTTDPEVAAATIGDQAGTPAAGSVILKTWKTLGGTPAAGTVGKKVNWIAIGT